MLRPMKEVVKVKRLRPERRWRRLTSDKWLKEMEWRQIARLGHDLRGKLFIGNKSFYMLLLTQR